MDAWPQIPPILLRPRTDSSDKNVYWEGYVIYTEPATNTVAP